MWYCRFSFYKLGQCLTRKYALGTKIVFWKLKLNFDMNIVFLKLKTKLLHRLSNCGGSKPWCFQCRSKLKHLTFGVKSSNLDWQNMILPLKASMIRLELNSNWGCLDKCDRWEVKGHVTYLSILLIRERRKFTFCPWTLE